MQAPRKFVIPAKAGIQVFGARRVLVDSGTPPALDRRSTVPVGWGGTGGVVGVPFAALASTGRAGPRAVIVGSFGSCREGHKRGGVTHGIALPHRRPPTPTVSVVERSRSTDPTPLRCYAGVTDGADSPPESAPQGDESSAHAQRSPLLSRLTARRDLPDP